MSIFLFVVLCCSFVDRSILFLPAFFFLMIRRLPRSTLSSSSAASDVYKRQINYRPAPYFRKVFDARKKIWSARAYIAVAGLYELYINGEKIGNHRLDPLYTRFDRRNFYVTYDITSQIQKGKNAIGVLLGNGWYNHCLLYTSPSPRDGLLSRMPSSA